MKGKQIGDINVDDSEFDVPERLLTLPRPHLSVSQINMYMRCPRQYEFRYVKDEKRPPSGNLIQGTTGHAALEKTHHHIVDHNQPAPTADVMDAFSTDWDKKLQDEVEWDEGENPGHMKDEGLALVRMYNETVAPKIRPMVVNKGAKDEVRGIEQEIRMTVEGVPMLGYIDLIDTDLDLAFSPEEAAMLIQAGANIPAGLRTAIVDLKFKAKSMTAAEADGSIQMTFYSLATGISAGQFSQLLKQKQPKFKPITTFRTHHDHAWFKQIVRGISEAISAGVFPPTDPTSWGCNSKWCGYWHMCRGKRG